MNEITMNVLSVIAQADLNKKTFTDREISLEAFGDAGKRYFKTTENAIKELARLKLVRSYVPINNQMEQFNFGILIRLTPGGRQFYKDLKASESKAESVDLERIQCRLDDQDSKIIYHDKEISKLRDTVEILIKELTYLRSGADEEAVKSKTFVVGP